MIRILEARSKTLRESRILLLRHAETAVPDVFHGAESDVALGEAGRRQAVQVAQALRGEGPVAVYCSTMRRAQETAEPIARACGLAPIVLDSLHERTMGWLSGQSRHSHRQHYAEIEARWIGGELDATHEGGESYAQIRRRVVPVFEQLAGRHAGETVVVVVHGVVIRVLLTSLCEALGPDKFATIGIEHVRVRELRWDGRRWDVRLDAFGWPLDGHVDDGRIALEDGR